MPSIVSSHRPQTLKQAKKAYRKSGATVRLSASELAAIERRAVLQERADRIKDREARRKANVKRKEERVQKEREARHRMGIVSPAKEGIHVGPSQLSLGSFIGVGMKRKWEEGSEDVKPKREEEESSATRACQTSSIPRTPWRNPLKVISPNLIISPSKIKKSEPCKHPPANAVRTPLDHERVFQDREEENENEKSKPTSKAQSLPMAPPPLPNSICRQSKVSTLQRQVPFNAPPHKPPVIVDESWDEFFASSTQIARELSPPTIKPEPFPPPLFHSPLHARPPVGSTLIDDTNYLLDLISTQDLDFSGIFTQVAPRPVTKDTNTLLAELSTQDLDFTGDLTQAAPSIPPPDTSDFDEDLTEEDLEDVVLEFEQESTTKSSTVPPDEKPPPKDISPDPEKSEQISDHCSSSISTTSDDGFHNNDFYDDLDHDFPSSDPALSEHDETTPYKESQEQKYSPSGQSAAEYEDFKLSTQDLCELEDAFYMETSFDYDE